MERQGYPGLASVVTDECVDEGVRFFVSTHHEGASLGELRRVRGNPVFVGFNDFETFFVAYGNIDVDNRGKPVCKRNFVLQSRPDFINDIQDVFAKDIAIALLYEEDSDAVQVPEDLFVFFRIDGDFIGIAKPALFATRKSEIGKTGTTDYGNNEQYG